MFFSLLSYNDSILFFRMLLNIRSKSRRTSPTMAIRYINLRVLRSWNHHQDKHKTHLSRPEEETSRYVIEKSLIIYYLSLISLDIFIMPVSGIINFIVTLHLYYYILSTPAQLAGVGICVHDRAAQHSSRFEHRVEAKCLAYNSHAHHCAYNHTIAFAYASRPQRRYVCVLCECLLYHTRTVN